MKIPSLDDLVQTGFLPSDEQLLSLVMKACARPDAVFVAMDILNRNYAYVSESCEAIMGYSADKFLQGGAIFMLSMLEPAYMLAMIEQQERNLREIKSPQFNPTTVLVHEYRAAIRQPVGPSKMFVLLGATLTYTPAMDLDTGIAIMCADDLKTIAENRALLLAIMDRYHLIVRPAKRELKDETLLKLFNYKLDHPLSSREEEVLKAIAQGHTTQQIAQALHIEENTVESHRKNILKKFEAKNVAELIKKASKIYWLE